MKQIRYLIITWAIVIGLGFVPAKLWADAPVGHFTVINADIVMDNSTGLMWQRAAAGPLAWRSGAPGSYIYPAKVYCDELSLGGYTWRLPTLKELRSLVDVRRSNPAIDTSFFSGEAEYFWSSTSSVYYTDDAWNVNFSNGFTISYSVSSTYRVRCVR